MQPSFNHRYFHDDNDIRRVRNGLAPTTLESDAYMDTDPMAVVDQRCRVKRVTGCGWPIRRSSLR